jgi:hypothetical protein
MLAKTGFVLLTFVIGVFTGPSALSLDNPGRQRAIFLEKMIFSVTQRMSFESFDLGEFDIGERIPVQIEFKNLTEEILEIRATPGSEGKKHLENRITRINPRESRIVALTIAVPEQPKDVNEAVAVGITLREGSELHIFFHFRVRGFIRFAKEVNSFVAPKEAKEYAFQIPLVGSDDAPWDDVQIDADSSLSCVKFTKRRDGNKCTIDARIVDKDQKFVSLLGKLYLLSKGKICDETTVKLKRQSDFEIYPDVLALKYDSVSKQYSGALTIRSMKREVPISNTRVNPVLSVDTEVSCTLGEMSSSTARIYVAVENIALLQAPKSTILFSVESPLTTEEHVLWVRILR